MTGNRMYIVATFIGNFPITRPKSTPQGALYAAENQISRALLEKNKISADNIGSKYGVWIRTVYPNIIQDAQEYISEVREIQLKDGETPRQFRIRYCRVSFDDTALREELV